MNTNSSSPKIEETGSILVVDDDPRNRTLLHDLLTSRGYAVFEAGAGEEALR
ncbi:MAG: hypothetical protein PHD86_09735 [Kiritimatiellae bacterium]|nr:hypothetical protein [Kiritimatiellia bacterium]